MVRNWMLSSSQTYRTTYRIIKVGARLAQPDPVSSKLPLKWHLTKKSRFSTAMMEKIL